MEGDQERTEETFNPVGSQPVDNNRSDEDNDSGAESNKYSPVKPERRSSKTKKVKVKKRELSPVESSCSESESSASSTEDDTSSQESSSTSSDSSASSQSSETTDSDDSETSDSTQSSESSEEEEYVSRRRRRTTTTTDKRSQMSKLQKRKNKLKADKHINRRLQRMTQYETLSKSEAILRLHHRGMGEGDLMMFSSLAKKMLGSDQTYSISRNKLKMLADKKTKDATKINILSSYPTIMKQSARFLKDNMKIKL